MRLRLAFMLSLLASTANADQYGPQPGTNNTTCQVFTGAGAYTWSKGSAPFYSVEGIGAGGPGGNGIVCANTTTCSGGAGGGPGVHKAPIILAASGLAGTETVTIGLAASPGGTSVLSSFATGKTYVINYYAGGAGSNGVSNDTAGGGGSAGASGNGGAGSAHTGGAQGPVGGIAGNVGLAASSLTYGIGTGGSGGPNGGSSSNAREGVVFAAATGASGAGLASTPAAIQGGLGGPILYGGSINGSGGVSGVAAGKGVDAANTGGYIAGASGGGGASVTSGTAGAAGASDFGAGGSGGGSVAFGGVAGGAGAAGGASWVRVCPLYQ